MRVASTILLFPALAYAIPHVLVTSKSLDREAITVDCDGYTAIQNWQVPFDWYKSESPCPFLNGLRNEQILPPSGTGYTKKMMICGLQLAGVGNLLAQARSTSLTVCIDIGPGSVCQTGYYWR